MYGGGDGEGKHTWGDVSDSGRDHLCPGRKSVFPEAESIHQLIQVRPDGDGLRKRRSLGWRRGRPPEGMGKKHQRSVERPSNGEHI